MAGQLREIFVKPFVKEKMADGSKKKRSSKWRKTRLVHLERQPACQNCGKIAKFLRRFRMQVHHIVPFHIAPHKELEQKNLLTLCGNPRCHLDKGHKGHFKSWNVDVVEDCRIWLHKYMNRP